LDGSFKGLICDGFDNGSEVKLNNRRIDTQANEASLFGILGYTSALQCDAIGRGNGNCFLSMITTFFFLAANRMIRFGAFLHVIADLFFRGDGPFMIQAEESTPVQFYHPCGQASLIRKPPKL
jgi:hypothetical protein